MTTEHRKRKPLWKRVEIICAVIVSIGAAIAILGGVKTWAQEAVAASVVKTRDAHFVADHKPIYDTLADMRKDIDTTLAKVSRMESTQQNIFFLLDAMATSDQKVQARNKQADAKYLGGIGRGN